MVPIAQGAPDAAPLMRSMCGKTCLVTGATSGMGAVTARALAQLGALVIGVGRHPERCAATAERLRQQTHNPNVEFLVADLSSQQEVRRLAQQVRQRAPRLHILVNNAGALFLRRRESVDGIELTFALNHLGSFLLTTLLLDTLMASAPSRIVTVSSYGHHRGSMDFADLQGKRRYSGMRAYRQSKLANLLVTYELARRLAGTGVTVNAVNPGLVATNFGLNNFGIRNAVLTSLVQRLYRLVAVSAEAGAQTAIYLATSPEVEGITGKYFERQRAIPSSPASYDEAAARRLWQISEEMTGIPRSPG